MRARCRSIRPGFTPDAQVLEASYESGGHSRGARRFLAYPGACLLVSYKLAFLFLSRASPAPRRSPTAHRTTRASAMDAIRSALSIVPSGTAATIIVGHALLTKVMLCVETNQ